MARLVQRLQVLSAVLGVGSAFLYRALGKGIHGRVHLLLFPLTHSHVVVRLAVKSRILGYIQYLLVVRNCSVPALTFRGLAANDRVGGGSFRVEIIVPLGLGRLGRSVGSGQPLSGSLRIFGCFGPVLTARINLGEGTQDLIAIFGSKFSAGFVTVFQLLLFILQLSIGGGQDESKTSIRFLKVDFLAVGGRRFELL